MFVTTFGKTTSTRYSVLKRNVCMTYDKIPSDASYIGVANTSQNIAFETRIITVS